MAELHSCASCLFCESLVDSSGRSVYLCVFDQSDCYLQEVGFWSDDCELDDFAEDLWQEKHNEIIQE